MSTDQKCDSLEGYFADDTSHEAQPKKVSSIGIRKSELLMKQYNHWVFKVTFLFTTFLVAYAYSLDSSIRSTYLATATSSYSQHALLSTVNVIKAVAAAACQPTYARLSDTFGRLELCIVAIIFYSVGTIIMSQAYDIYRYAGGSVLYQIGYTGMILVVHVILAVFSNLDWRLFYYYVAGLPFIINTWVSGNVAASSLQHYSWNYSIGMWAFIFPLSALPFLGCLVVMAWKASKTDEWRSLREEEREINKWRSWKDNLLVDLFWRIDIVGVLLIICILGFILVPLTIAGGVEEKWKHGYVIAPLVIGFVLIVPLVLWEAKFSKYPVLPYALLRDRGVWSALFISLMINLVYMMPNDYMYTVLVVGMRASIKAATRIDSLFDFVATIVGPLVGLAVVKYKRLKGFVIFGVACWIISMGILLHFRGDNDGVDSQKFINGVIGGLCLMGFGAGFFTHGAYVSIQLCTNHEYMAVVISIYLACFNVGMALGSSISGAVWTNTLYSNIVDQFQKAGVDTSLAKLAYASPLSFIVEYKWGSTERIALAIAYSHTQRILCIVGLVLCFPLLFDTFLLRDHKLESVQSLETNEEQCGEQEVVVNKNDDDVITKKLLAFFRYSRK
ncbi:uncharacterized protein PRCAT00005838001 [Priceomyces carsonii]|uniref:uncharacterized protein n=1 Tax=Priceomyces carsonii TaxID=28549 RepID=UPI002ED8AB80|nr:unnamed protein product [Priceomyces carsonii]